MPPSLDSSTIGTIWGSLRGVWTGSGKKKHTDVSVTTSAPDEASQSTPSRPARGTQVEERDTQRKDMSKKRESTEEAFGSRPSKRHQSRREEEGRLLGSFGASEESVPLGMPQAPREQSPPTNRDTKMSAKPGAGPHRYMNTLSERRFRPAKQPTGFFAKYHNPDHAQKQGQERSTRYTLDMHPSKGSNVPAQKVLLGDEFEEHDPQPSNKKQKLRNGAAKVKQGSHPVDLTEDGPQRVFDEDIKVVARNGKPLSNASPDSHKQRDFSLHSREYDNVMQYTVLEQEKKPRRRGGKSSSQGLSRATSFESQQCMSHDPRRQQEQHTVDEEEKEVQITAKQQPERLPIDLENGISGARKTSSSKLCLMGAKRAPDVTDPKVEGYGRLEELQERHKAQVDAMPWMTRRRTANREADAHSTTSRLSDKFSRVDGSAKQRKPRQRDRMLEISHRVLDNGARKSLSQINSKRTSLGSEDELASASTIQRPPTQSLSPPKTQDPNSEDCGPLNNHSSERDSADVADLRPTEFKGLKSTRPTKSANAAASERTENSEQPGYQIPINLFMCQACLVEGDGLSLVWNEKEHSFNVASDGELVVGLHPHGKPVSIGPHEATKWFAAKENLVVHITGSKTEISAGSILIGFLDDDGLRICFEHLVAHSNTRMVLESEKPSRMDGRVKTQKREIKDDYLKREAFGTAMRERQREVQSENPAKNAPARRRMKQPGEEVEHIIYEQPESPRQDDAGSDARGSNFERGARPINRHGRSNSPETTSRFFLSEPRRSARHTSATNARTPIPPPAERWTRVNKPQRWSHSVVYPADAPRRVTVDFEDLERLDEGEFLNDNVISFALREIEENMASEHRQNVHFFNSFFYTALTSKNGRKAFNYDAVKRWTKNKDLFNMPYIIVPINIELHWFVAIICNLPALRRKAVGLDDGDNDLELLQAAPDEENKMGGEDVLNDAMDDRETSQAMENLTIRDQNKNYDDTLLKTTVDSPSSVTAREIDDNPVAPSTSLSNLASGKKAKKKSAPPLRRFDPDTPAILMLDSFGTYHSVATRDLKDYLNAEANEKRGMSVESQQLQGLNAKGIPQQTNLSDCGVYLVGYIEQFAKDPRKFVTKVLRKELDQQADFASFDPSAKRAEIRNELLRLYQEQHAERNAKKGEKRAKPVNPKAAPEVRVARPTLQTAASKQGKEGTTERIDSHEISESQAHRSPPVTDANLAADVDAEEELDIEVPRALETAPSHRLGKGAASSPQQDPAKSETEEYEMLDGPDRTENTLKTDGSAIPQSHASANSLPDPLSNILKQGLAGLQRNEQPSERVQEDEDRDMSEEIVVAVQPPQGVPRVDERETSEEIVVAGPGANERSDGAMKGSSHEREIIDLDDGQSQPVVQDSQEGRSVEPSKRRTGVHTKLPA